MCCSIHHSFCSWSTRTPEAPPEDPGGAEELPEVLALLGRPGQLPSVRALLGHLLVGDADREQGDLLPRPVARRRVQRHAEDAEAGRQHLAGAAPATLDEELDGEAIADELSQVALEDDGEDAVVLEGATDEEGAPAAEDGPEGDGDSGEAFP